MDYHESLPFNNNTFDAITAIFDSKKNQVRDIMADVVDCNTYKEYLDKQVMFFGDGAMKCEKMINHKNATYLEGISPSRILEMMQNQYY